ncbi:hypothetical protein ACFO6R_15945 [Eubacterium multiforme]|uniref:Class IIb bacteriocin, lactobin A/cerein 7B family n=1 Tax=Eubacterium multiforme TaxID=83339 RepID=A0ABT9UTJ7_9FIRM|nr:hypothetical protein [Eubacterium multiforme]MDQ0149646.1 hypothetical protein [Eubacterium multiforme]
MNNLENLGLMEEEDISKFSVLKEEEMDMTSPVWSNVLKTVLAAGGVASVFL